MSASHFITPRTVVYFIQRGVGGPIKIGKTARDPSRRIVDLKTSTPEPLVLLGVTPQSVDHTERSIHRLFKADRLNGEWFSPSPKLMDFIRVHARPFSPDMVDGPGPQVQRRRPGQDAIRRRRPTKRMMELQMRAFADLAAAGWDLHDVRLLTGLTTSSYYRRLDDLRRVEAYRSRTTG